MGQDPAPAFAGVTEKNFRGGDNSPREIRLSFALAPVIPTKVWTPSRYSESAKSAHAELIVLQENAPKSRRGLGQDPDFRRDDRCIEGSFRIIDSTQCGFAEHRFGDGRIEPDIIDHEFCSGPGF